MARLKPDYVTFGKGIIVDGVAKVARGNSSAGYGASTYGSTLTNHNELFLKGAQVLNRIRTGRLMENAADTGKYLLSKLREEHRPLACRLESYHDRRAAGVTSAAWAS